MRINWKLLIIGITLALIVTGTVAVITGIFFGVEVANMVGFFIGVISGSVATQYALG